MIRFIDARGQDVTYLTKEMFWRKKILLSNSKDIVSKIIEDVSKKGDIALLDYTEKFDNIKCKSASELIVDRDEILNAYNLIDKKFIDVIKKTIDRIYRFHETQQQKSYMIYEKDGSILGMKVEPIEKVGIYVPGGQAAYPSTVLMNAIPAKIAGVKQIIMASPPSKDNLLNPYTLVAANETGCDMIIKVGGAQAIAALAYGTETVPRVDKIVGPGNVFVTLAKREVYGLVDIDMIAGPSEVLVIADDSANPEYVASDMIAQAEHDQLASSILLTNSYNLSQNVLHELKKQLNSNDRINVIRDSLEKNGTMAVLDTIDQAITIANVIASEHLELCVKDPFEKIPYVKNAGAIFLGNYTPEAIGDYMAGPNHVLPTHGTARFYSPLSVEQFTKKSSILYFPSHALHNLSEDAMFFANIEGLTAHANSIRVRIS